MLRRALATVLVLFVAFVVLGPSFFHATHRLPIAETPTQYGLRFDAVTFKPTDRAIALKGWWIPAPEPRAAVVMVHGGGDDNRTQPYQNGLALARDLVGRGFSVMAFDLRNYGESDGTPEGPTFGDLEGYDVQGAIDEIARRAPDLAVAGIGCSMGGATLVHAAVREPRLAAIVLDSAYPSAERVAVPFFVAASGWPRVLVGPFVWSAVHLHGLPLRRGDTLAAARKLVGRPTLVVENAADPLVSLADARELATTIVGSEQWITPAPPPDHQQGPFGTHCQSYKLGPAEYVDTVTAFLTRALHLAPR